MQRQGAMKHRWQGERMVSHSGVASRSAAGQPLCSG